MVVKLRTDLMSDSFSSIWIELGLPRKKKFLVCQIYREWQLLNPTLGNSSTDEGDQLIRWLEFLDQWERALDSGLEVHVMGDFNIDQCNWTLPNTRLKSLIHALFMQILPRGVSQLVIGPTRHCPYQSSSGLDHFYTNSPSRISCVEKIVCGGSDHMLISVKRSTKMNISSPAYIRKRSFRNFNSDDFVAAIRQISWLDIYLCSNIDDAVKLLSEKITFILDIMAPLKTVQVRKKYNPWLSKTTKDMMVERDRLHGVAIQSKSSDDWAQYKSLRNKVINRQRIEEKSGKKARLDQCSSDASRMWKEVRNILNWGSTGSPTQLSFNGHFLTKPQDIANAQNQFFINKVKNIKDQLPAPTIDPLAKLKELMKDRKCIFKLNLALWFSHI